MTCPHCGFEADSDQEECPLCGTPLDGGREEPGTTGVGKEASGPGRGARSAGRESGPDPGPDRGGGADLTPWEARGGLGALADSWWESLTDPERFYSRLPWDDGLTRAVLYFLVFWVLAAGFEAVWFAVFSRLVGSAIGVGELAAGGGSGLLGFFLSPFKGLVGLALASGALHLAAVALADRPRSVGATARALCYATGPQVLRAVPVAGPLAAFLWSGFLAVVGVRTAHRTTTFRAAAAVGIVFVVFTLAATAYGLYLLTRSGGGLPVPAGMRPAG